MARPKKNPPADLVMPVHDNPVYPDVDTLQADLGDPVVEQPEVHLEAPPSLPEPEPEPDRLAFINTVVAQRDPSVSIANAIICIGEIYNSAGLVSAALTKHLPTCATQPELHSFLHRMQTFLGEFRNGVTQIETSISDSLREAIETIQP